MRRILGSAFLIAAILITQIPATGVFAVSQAADFQMKGTTLVKYTGTEQSVSVPDGVKVIGESAFADNTYITQVTLPSSVTTVNYDSFSNCTNLTQVTLNDEVTSLQAGAFSDCSALSKINFGSALTKLGTGVFTGCTSLSNITVSTSNKKFVCTDGAIYSKDMTTLYELLPGSSTSVYSMPSTIKQIEPYACFGCDKLTNVIISSNVTEIPAFAFANCQYLTTATIPYSVTTISDSAFSDCRNLGTLSIPESVTKIADTAFDRCYNLKIVAADGTVAAEYAKTWATANADQIAAQDANKAATTQDSSISGTDTTTTTNPTSTTSGTPQTDVATTSATSGTMLGETKVVTQNAVVFIDNTKQTVHGAGTSVAGDTTATTTPTTGDTTASAQTTGATTSDQVSPNLSAIQGTGDGVKGVYIPKYAIVGNNIVDFAFYGNNSLTDYTVPDNITSINDFAFARTNLKYFTVPVGVTHIGYGAFYHSDNLENISIPSTVTDIETSAFDHTKYMDNWKSKTNGSNFLIVGDGILIGYKGTDASVTIPENVKKITSEVFMNHSEITSVTLPNSLISIGEDAFNGCNKLSDISGGSYIQNIKDRAFANTAISTIRISTDVTNIGLGAFSEITNNLDSQNAFQSVVFYGDNIPVLSYEKTATRYSNSKYRIPAFGNVTLAVVNENVDLTNLPADNVLTNANLGFYGLIGSITQEATADQPGIIKVRMCTSAEYNSKTTALPTTAVVYGNTYNLVYDGMVYQSVAKPSATDTTTITDTQPAGSATPASTTQAVSNATQVDNLIQITNNSTLFPANEYITGYIQGNTQPLYVTISDSTESDSAIRAAYESVYQTIDSSITMLTFDLSVMDENNQVPIKKFGVDTMTMTLPISSDMAAGYVHIITLDEDGQLEDIPCTVTQNGAIYVVSFGVTHCSPYAVYVNTSLGNVTVADTSGLTYLSAKKDQSPATGDHGISSKWFVALGLFCISMILFLYRRKPKYNAI